jgi:hypothetical protein
MTPTPSKSSTQRCAGARCRNMILAEDPRVKVGKYTYCIECKEETKVE